jgi:hypothetical protein
MPGHRGDFARMTVQVFSELWARGLAFYLFDYWWMWAPPLLGAAYFGVKKRRRLAFLNVGMFALASVFVPALITQARYNEILSPEAQERNVAYLLVLSNAEARTLPTDDLVNLVSSVEAWARSSAQAATERERCVKRTIHANAAEYMIDAISNGDEQASVMASIIKLAQAACERDQR